MSTRAVTDSLALGAPARIDRPAMLQRWTQLSFVHWAYEPEAVQGILPPELAVDPFDGAAWSG